MSTYVAFLRAVNVGRRQVRMADLRAWLADEGFTDVATHIQTGNVTVTSRMRSPDAVRRRLESVLAERCGFEVPCVVVTAAELSRVHAEALVLENPFGDRAGQRRYVCFFSEPVPAEDGAAMAAYDDPDARIWARGTVVHVWIAGDFHDARVLAVFRKALAPGTVRDLKVVAALAEKWGR